MSDKQKKIDTILDSFNKEFGEDSAVRLNSDKSRSKVHDVLSSGAIVVDSVLSDGKTDVVAGIAEGQITEISGLNSSGKTTLCAQYAAKMQEKGGLVVVVDTEERIDEKYWQNLGVNTSEVISLHANTLEEVFDKQYFTAKKLQEHAAGVPILMLWDSIGMTSSGYVDDEDGKGSVMERAGKLMGRDAKTIGSGLKIMRHLVSNLKMAYVFTNHVYHNLKGYGPEYETYGGEKVKYSCTYRLQLKRGAAIKEEDSLGNPMTVGAYIHVSVLKNSLSTYMPTRTAVIRDGVGFCNDYTVMEIARQLKLITGKGWATWTTPNGKEVKFQGWPGFKEKVVTDSEYPALCKIVYATLCSPPAVLE